MQHYYVTGYRCESHNNPADFFLDVVNGDARKSVDDVTEEKKDPKCDVTKKPRTKSSEDFARIAGELNGKYLISDARWRLEKDFVYLSAVFKGSVFNCSKDKLKTEL